MILSWWLNRSLLIIGVVLMTWLIRKADANAIATLKRLHRSETEPLRDRLHAFEDTTRQLLAAYDELQSHPTGNNLAAAVQLHVDELGALVEGKTEEPKL
jgi:hypothetical protein